MKFLPLIVILNLITSCSSEAPAADPLAMECKYIGDTFYRCVNPEVICYEFAGELSCVKKDKEVAE